MVLTLFWISLFVLWYIYIGYLLISMLIGTLFGRPVRKSAVEPMVTLLIPAYNEEGVIAEKLKNSLELEYPADRLEIVVASESTDSTNDIVRRFADRGVRLVAFTTRQGKSRMLYETIPQTRGEIILFSDANAIYEKKVVRTLVRNFSDPRIGGVLGRLIITNAGTSATSGGESLYKKYEGLLRNAHSRLQSLFGADGSMFAVRRQLYAPISPDQGDDFEIAVRILLKGYGVVFEPEAVSYESASESGAAEIRRKRRIVSWFWRSSFVLLAEMLHPVRPLLIWQMISHKMLRWLSPFFCLILLVCSVLLYGSSGWIRMLFWLQAVFYGVGIAGGRVASSGTTPVHKIVRLANFFVMFNSAFFIATLEAIAVRHKPYWEKVRD